MYHSVFVSKVRLSPQDPQAQETVDSFKCIGHAECDRAFAIHTADQAVQFGGWKTARVFAGKTRGRLVYTTTAEP